MNTYRKHLSTQNNVEFGVEGYFQCRQSYVLRQLSFISICLGLITFSNAGMADSYWVGSCSNNNWSNNDGCPANNTNLTTYGNITVARTQIFNWYPIPNAPNAIPADSTTNVNIIKAFINNSPLITTPNAFAGQNLNLGSQVDLQDKGTLTGHIENIGTTYSNNDVSTYYPGIFNQSGTSIHTVDILNLNSNSVYSFSGGQLNAKNINNNGTFNQNDSSTITVSENLNVGNGGVYNLTGGQLNAANINNVGKFYQNGTSTTTVAENFNIGNGGVYNITSGQLNATNITNNGTFNQNDSSTITVSENLNVGNGGVYNMTSGLLNTSTINLNYIRSVTNGAMFNQSGSAINAIANALNIGDSTFYHLIGGSLNVANINNNGMFTQSGGSISGFGQGVLTFTNTANFYYQSGSFKGNLINNIKATFEPIVNDRPSTETFAANISGTGNVIKDGTGTLILTGQNSYSGGTTVTAGVLQGNSTSLQGNIANNSATVVFDQNINGTYDGVMSGSGNLVKQNTGLLTLNGINTSTGNTEVVGGTLQVGDATHANASMSGPITVDAGATLSGHGSINGNVNNSGTLAPGGSIGNLTVNGDVNFNPGSTFNVEIDPQQSSQLNVSNQANLGNANVSVLADPGTYTPHTYTILNAGTVAGNFSNVNISSAAPNPSLNLLTPSLQYFPNRVDLNLDVTPDPTGPLPKITRKLIPDILRIGGGRFNQPLGQSCPNNRISFWARGIGMLSSADASGNAPRYDSDTAGTAIGLDRQFNEHLILGIAGFYAHTDATTYQRFNNKSSADSLGIMLYSVFTDGAWQFKGAIGYDNDTYNTQRTVALSAIPGLALSKTHANHVNGYTEASYSFKSGDFTLQPLVGLQLGWMRQDGFSESSANTLTQNLSVSGRTLYTLDTLVGLRAREDVRLSNKFKAQFEIRTLYDHDFGTLQDAVAGRFSNGQVGLLSTADRPDQRDAGILGASFSLLHVNSLSFNLDYNGSIRSGQQSHFISAGIRYSW